jgi:hypothetical protein
VILSVKLSTAGSTTNGTEAWSAMWALYCIDASRSKQGQNSQNTLRWNVQGVVYSKRTHTYFSIYCTFVKAVLFSSSIGFKTDAFATTLYPSNIIQSMLHTA